MILAACITLNTNVLVINYLQKISFSILYITKANIQHDFFLL
jgi:hypothetical protein